MAAGHFLDLGIGEIKIPSQFFDHDLAKQRGEVLARLTPHIEDGTAVE